jgi:two-component system, LuxR family, sensor kinase FixL
MINASSGLSLQSLLDVALDAVFILDHRGRIEEFNRAAERLFGYAKSEVIGSNVSQLMPRPLMERHDGFIEGFLARHQGATAGVGREVEGCRKDGSVFPGWISLSLMPDCDPPHFVAFLHDMSPRLEAETQRSLLAAREAELANLSEMTRMAAGLAHDLNQPLAAISNYALACERLLNRPEPDLGEVRDALREISGQALRAGEFIQRLRKAVNSRMQSASGDPAARQLAPDG